MNRIVLRAHKTFLLAYVRCYQVKSMRQVNKHCLLAVTHGLASTAAGETSAVLFPAAAASRAHIAESAVTRLVGVSVRARLAHPSKDALTRVRPWIWRRGSLLLLARDSSKIRIKSSLFRRRRLAFGGLTGIFVRWRCDALFLLHRRCLPSRCLF